MISPASLHPDPRGLGTVEIIEGLVDLVPAELVQLLADPGFERKKSRRDLQDDFACRAVLDDGDGFADLLEGKPVGDDRARVELAVPDQPDHLVQVEYIFARSRRRG